MGPAIVTADEISDPHALAISLAIDGETLQDSNTSNLIFNVPDLSRIFRACSRWNPAT